MEQKLLYLIQDPDRPMHVVAGSWENALFKWKQFIAAENDMKPCDVEQPQGIMLVAGANDLLA